MRPLKRSVALLCTLALFATMLSTQQTAPAKRPLTHQDYDSWRSITASPLSRDGTFVAYAYKPQDGGGQLVVRNTARDAAGRSGHKRCGVSGGASAFGATCFHCRQSLCCLHHRTH